MHRCSAIMDMDLVPGPKAEGAAGPQGPGQAAPWALVPVPGLYPLCLNIGASRAIIGNHMAIYTPPYAPAFLRAPPYASIRFHVRPLRIKMTILNTPIPKNGKQSTNRNQHVVIAVCIASPLQIQPNRHTFNITTIKFTHTPHTPPTRSVWRRTCCH